jgi:hypothetical protein
MTALARACAERRNAAESTGQSPEEMTLFLSLFRGTVNPSSATIQSSILPIPCKTLSPSPLPCYPLPCISNPMPPARLPPAPRLYFFVLFPTP